MSFSVSTRAVLCAGLLAASITAVTLPAQAESQSGSTATKAASCSYWVTGSKVAVRSGPDTTKSIIGYVYDSFAVSPPRTYTGPCGLYYGGFAKGCSADTWDDGTAWRKIYTSSGALGYIHDGCVVPPN
ncbi:hypothetical protein PS9374_04829 [Planomonospora sphaerica]|uniref:SH3 domain-containing protein n=1 Tax=Planomonospora sphaerica TaxID=161355 RepID=A0A171DK11_9ACTN|nr:hypothetical protein [Planomonospora sphaerica]GAT69158.1 hypothetical protein PS9374_04829 [Planomonospora sphaerica]